MICDGCEYSNPATRRVKIETSPGSGRVIERDVCEQCYAELGQPETIEYYEEPDDQARDED